MLRHRIFVARTCAYRHPFIRKRALLTVQVRLLKCSFSCRLVCIRLVHPLNISKNVTVCKVRLWKQDLELGSRKKPFVIFMGIWSLLQRMVEKDGSSTVMEPEKLTRSR